MIRTANSPRVILLWLHYTTFRGVWQGLAFIRGGGENCPSVAAATSPRQAGARGLRSLCRPGALSSARSGTSPRGRGRDGDCCLITAVWFALSAQPPRSPSGGAGAAAPKRAPCSADGPSQYFTRRPAFPPRLAGEGDRRSGGGASFGTAATEDKVCSGHNRRCSWDCPSVAAATSPRQAGERGSERRFGSLCEHAPCSVFAQAAAAPRTSARRRGMRRPHSA